MSDTPNTKLLVSGLLYIDGVVDTNWTGKSFCRAPPRQAGQTVSPLGANEGGTPHSADAVPSQDNTATHVEMAGNAEATSSAATRDYKFLGEHLEEARPSPIVALRRPEEPTAEERRRHEIDHLPFVGWCRSCVAGRGKADQHCGKDHDEDAIARISCDYCFLGEKVEDDKLSDKCLPILVHTFHADR